MSTNKPKELYGCLFKFTEYQQAGYVYAMGADVSSGVGGDSQACILLSKRGEIITDVAYLHTNTMKVVTYAYYLNELSKEFNFPLLAVEANSMGRQCIDELQELNHPNLYFSDEKRERPGWNTSAGTKKGVTKETMLRDLAEAIALNNITIRFKPLLQQLISFQRLEGREGKMVIKSVGKHDDLVMALAIAYQMIKGESPVTGKFKSLLVETKTSGMWR